MEFKQWLEKNYLTAFPSMQGFNPRKWKERQAEFKIEKAKKAEQEVKRLKKRLV